MRPPCRAQEREDAGLSDWDRFARAEYVRLALEEEGDAEDGDTKILDEPWCGPPPRTPRHGSHFFTGFRTTLVRMKSGILTQSVCLRAGLRCTQPSRSVSWASGHTMGWGAMALV